MLNPRAHLSVQHGLGRHVCDGAAQVAHHLAVRAAQLAQPEIRQLSGEGGSSSCAGMGELRLRAG